MGHNNAQHLDVAGGGFWGPGLAAVGDLHGGAAVVTLRGVPHVLDPAVRESNLPTDRERLSSNKSFKSLTHIYRRINR